MNAELSALESLVQDFPGLSSVKTELTHAPEGVARVNSIELMRALMALDSAQRAREGQEPG